VVIVNWNARDILYDCLKSVYEETKGIDFETVVVDNASKDGSAQMVKANFAQVTLLENRENRGFAAANNQGIEIAKGRYILLLNSDTIILDGAITRTVVFADNHQEAAVVGCRVLNPDRTLQQTCFMFPSVGNMILASTYLYKIFPRSKFFGRERMTWWDRSDMREVQVVSGCFMLIRCEAVHQVGLMDERFFMYAEETDWCYRFKQAGWKMLFTPEAEIIHLGGQSTKLAAPEMILQLKGGILQFMYKHHSRWVHRLACVLVWLFFMIRVPAWFIKFILSPDSKEICWMWLTTYVNGMKKMISDGFEGLCVKSDSLKS